MSEELEWFSLEELTSRVAQLIWVEQTLSEVMVAWSSAEPAAARAVFYAEAGRHHRWHAEILTTCLPTSEQLVSASEVRAPSEQWSKTALELRALGAEDDSSLRAQALTQEIHPWLDREETALRDIGGPTSAKHLIRWLRFIALDHHDHLDRVTNLVRVSAAEPTRLSDRAALGRMKLTH